MQYYYLIAGLTDYPFDVESVVSGGIRIDVPQVKRQIMSELSDTDRRAVELLYTYYDIENIVGYVKSSKLPFNELGNLTRDDIVLLVGRMDHEQIDNRDGDSYTLLPEELAELEQRLAVPSSIRWVVDRFKMTIASKQSGYDQTIESEDFIPLSVDDFERELFQSFYRICGQVSSLPIVGNSVPDYLRAWVGYDRMIRNIIVAYKGRAMQLSAEQLSTMIVEESPEVKDMLINSQSSDFGLKDTFRYTEELLSILGIEDFVDRERRMDILRGEIADELSEHDYFGIGKVMNYLIHLNIMHRWAALDSDSGRGNFRAIVSALTDADKIAESVGA